MIHRTHVIHNFVHVTGKAIGEDMSLGGEQVLKRALGALDLARKHRPLPYVHEDEKVRVRQGQYGAIQATQRTVGLRESSLEIARDPYGWPGRERRGYESTEPGGLRDIATGSSEDLGRILALLCVYHGRPFAHNKRCA